MRSRSLFLAALLGLMACGDDSDDDQAGDGKSYTLSLVGITADNADAPILTSHKVELLDDKGASLVPPVTYMTSTTDGKVTLVPPANAASIYVIGVGPVGGTSTYDTVVLNHNWNSGETLLRISSGGTLMLAEQSGGFVASQERAAASGAVYWTKDKKRSGPIGCAKIYLDGSVVPDEEQAQRYVGQTPLPALLSKEDKTFPGRGQFYFGNLKTGSHTIKATLDDGQSFIGETTFFISKTRKDSMSPTKSILYQLAIDVEAPANPTPATCVR